MIVYSKVINDLESYKTMDGNSNVVCNIYWEMVAAGDGVSASFPAITYVPYIAGQAFVPFDQLTKETVEGWIDSFTPPAAMQEMRAQVDRAITQLKLTTKPPLPWAPPASPSA